MSPNDHGRGRSRSKSPYRRDSKSSYSRRDYESRDNEEKRGGRSRHSRSGSRTKRKRYSHSKSRSRSNERREPYRQRRQYGQREERRIKECRCVGVFGLNFKTTENQLHHIFNKYGSIDKITLIYDRESGRSRGFGFIYYFNNEDARSAKENCSGMEIDGSIIRVDFSITYKGNTPPQGPYAPREDRYGRRDDDNDHYNDRGDRGHYSNRGSYRDRGDRERARHSPSPKYRERRGYERDRERSRSRSIYVSYSRRP